MVAATETFWFDEEAADRACEFFETYLTHCKGELAGEPFILDPWQRDDLIRPLFGWKRQDGTRRYRYAYWEIPRKNGKSTLCAGVALYLLTADGEPGAEVYSAASDRDQASIVFDVAAQMVGTDESLDHRVEVHKSVKTMFVERTFSKYKALSAEAFTKHGLNASGIVFDELHAQPDRELYDVLDTSVGARRQPLMVMITTAGYDRHSICYEQRDYAIKVRDGIIDDPSFHVAIYAADEDDDWTSEETWKKANPGYGTSVKPEYLATKCAAAQQSAALENTFKRLHLNIWTEQAVRWLQMKKWDACTGTISVDDLRGQECWAGLDMSTTTDITALVLYFPEVQHTLLPFFWVPEESARERERRDRVPYTTWTRDGFIKATDGNVVDYDVVRADINEIGKIYNIREIAIDRWNSTQLQTQLMGDGFEVVQFGQGYASMSAPTKYFEKLVIAKDLTHIGNPVLRWMAANASVEIDAAENMKPSKKKSTERIDGVVASIMAVGRAMVDEVQQPSVYEGRGVIAI